MADQVVTLRLTADGTGVIKTVDLVSKGLGGVGKSGAVAGQQVTQSFAKAQTGLDAFKNQIKTLKQQLLGVGVGALGLRGISALRQAADEYTNLNSRIKLVTSSQAEATAVSNQVFAIAQRTRADLSATGLLYTQVARSSASLGVSQAQVAKITETVNQSFVISGATLESAKNAMVQLNQGLAAGALRGDEFNSVVEQAPIIMDLLGASLGKTRGELREFAAQGGISAKILTDALLTGAADVQKQFDGMAITISGASQQISNAFVRFVGESSNAVGASSLLAAALGLVAENFAILANAALLLGGVFAGRLLVGWAVTSLAARSVAIELGIAGAAATGFGASLAGAGRAALAFAGGPIGLLVLGLGALVLATRADTAARAAHAAAIEAERKRVANLTDDLEFFADTLSKPTKIVALADIQAQANTAAAELAKARQEMNKNTNALDLLNKAAGSTADGQARMSTLVRSASKTVDEQRAIVDRLTAAFDKLAGVLLTRLGPEVEAVKTAFANLSFSPQSLGSLGSALGNLFGKQGEVQAADQGLQTLLANAAAMTTDLDGKLKTVGKSAVQIAQDTANAILDAAKAARLPDGELAKAQAVGQALVDKARAYDAAAAAAKAAQSSANELARAERTVNDVVVSLTDHSESLASATRGPLVQAEQAHIEALRKIASAGGKGVTAAAKLQTSAIAQARVQSAVTAAIEAENKAYGANIAALELDAQARAAQLGPLDDILAQYQAEIDVLSASDEARARVIDSQEIEAATLKVVGEMQRLNAEALRNGTALTKIDTEEIRRRITAKQQELSLEKAQEALRTQGGNTGFLGGLDGKTLFSGSSFEDLLSNAVRNAFSTKNLSGFFDSFGKAFSRRVGESGEAAGERISANVAGALSFVDGAIKAIKEEGIVGGLLTVGSQIPGIVGSIAQGIKAAIGIFKSLFGKKPKLTLSGSSFAGAEANITTAFGQIFLDNDRTKIESDKILTAVRDFDSAIAQAVGAFAGGAERIAAISDRLVNFTSKLKGGDATPENLLKERFGAILSTFDGVIQAFVNKGFGLEEQVQRLAEVLSAEADFNAADLGIDFSVFLDIADTMKIAGESVAETAKRIVGSVALLESLSDRAGVVFDATGEAFIRLATKVSEVAGGLDKTTALFNTFFDTFFTAEENAVNAVATTDATRTSALAAVGLDPAVSNAEFRTAFLAALPTASAEEINAWLQASSAIRAASDAQDAYNAILNKDAVILAQALDDFNAKVADLGEELIRSNLTEFGSEIRDINQWADDARKQLTDLAHAAGLSAASEEDLAAVHQIAALRAGEAMRKLRARALELVSQLQGTRLDTLGEQIAAIEAAQQAANQSQLDGIDAVQQAAADSAQAQIDAQRQIRDFIANIDIGASGGLRPRDQLTAGLGRFQELLALARGGDANAAQALPGLVDELLRLGQQVFASGDGFFALKSDLLGGLNEIANRPIAQVGGAGGGGGSTAVTVSPELQALYDERDALLAQQTAAQRLELAQQLSAAIRDLVIATGEPLADITASLDLNLSALIADLGINLEDLSTSTAAQLATVAQSMGVNLTDLAAQVGVDLGDLADAQSLLNDALQGSIAGLPQEQRDQLEPLLASVEAAAALGDTAGVETGIDAMTQAINQMSPLIRDQLAPFFADIAPIDYTQLDALAFIDNSTRDLLIESQSQTDLLRSMERFIKQPPVVPPSEPIIETAREAREFNRIGIDHGSQFERMLRNMAALNNAQGIASFSVGTGFVPRTGLYQLHQGESVFPTAVNSFFRRAGFPVAATGAAGDSSQVVAAIAKLRDQQRVAAERAEARMNALEQAIARSGKDQAEATKRQTEALRVR